MKKFALFALAAACVVIGSLAAAPQEASALGDACVRKEFKTNMVKDACVKGGQAEARKVMKKFLSSAKAKNPEITSCKSCHTSLIPDYKLAPDGLSKYVRAGGK